MSAALAFVAPDWATPRGVHALCTTREGGVSNAPCDSLNLGDHVGDAVAAVLENRRRLRARAGLPAEPAWMQQVHGINVLDLDARNASAPDVSAQADAVFTTTPGRVCAVLTADCLPVLLAASDGSVVGAAHAGWRGLAAGVIESAAAALRRRLPAAATLQAWLGPAISAANFEVGDDVYHAFFDRDAGAAAAFVRNDAGRWQCDLHRLARRRLQALGIVDISGAEHCTYADATRFFSHRRDVQHRKQATTGRMATLIWREIS
jgi:YfiH family protein